MSCYAPIDPLGQAWWPLPRVSECPLVAYVGACCSGCAEGNGCSGDEELEEHHARVGALYVTDAELDTIGTQIALMSTDVDQAAKLENVEWPHDFAVVQTMKACRAANLKWGTAEGKCLSEPDPTGASYPKSASALRPLTVFQNERWTPFVLDWNAYRGSVTPITVADPTAVEALRARFATLADEWRGPLGQKTRAVVPDPLSQGFRWELYALIGAGLLIGGVYFLGAGLLANALRKVAA